MHGIYTGRFCNSRDGLVGTSLFGISTISGLEDNQFQVPRPTGGERWSFFIIYLRKLKINAQLDNSAGPDRPRERK